MVYKNLLFTKALAVNINCRFEKDMNEVLPNRGGAFRTILSWYWKVTIMFLSPLALLVIFVYYIYNQIINPLTYEAWIPELVSTPKCCHKECLNINIY